MSIHPNNPNRPYTEWHQKRKWQLRQLESFKEPKPEWVIKKIAELKATLAWGMNRKRKPSTAPPAE